MMPGMVPNPIVGVSLSQMVAAPIEVESSNLKADANTSELHKSYLRALEQADDEESNIEVLNKASFQPFTQAILRAPKVTVPQAATEIPDLLSGFEKVVKGMKVVPTAATSLPSNTPQDHSPPFTSRSFDEFHRFLSKDEISLLDETTADTPQCNPSSHDNKTIQSTSAIALDTDALFTAGSYALLSEVNGHGSTLPTFNISGGHNLYEVENILQQVERHRIHHEPSSKSETMSSDSSYGGRFTGNSPSGRSSSNPPTDVTISNRQSNVGPLSSPSTTKTNYVNATLITASMWSRNHHITASSRSEDANIVSGSEPSGGSSSSRSNASNTSSGTNAAGATFNQDDSSEEEGLTSSGGEFDSAEDDDMNGNGRDQQQSPSSSCNLPPRKRAKGIDKHLQRIEHGKRKKVQFQ